MYFISKKYVQFISLQAKYEDFLPFCILGWPQMHYDLEFPILPPPLGGKVGIIGIHTDFLWSWNKTQKSLYARQMFHQLSYISIP